MEIFSPLTLQRFIYLTLNKYLVASRSVPDIVPGAEDFTVNQTRALLLTSTHSDCSCSGDAGNKQIITYTAISTISLPVELWNLVSWC